MTEFDRFQWFNQFVDDERVDDSTLALLAVLMRFMGRRGKCHPSNATIATRLGRSEDTVRRRVKTAEDLGYVETTQTPGLGKSYTAKLPEYTPSNTATPSSTATPCTNATPSKGATSTGATPGMSATPPPAPVPPHPPQGCKGTPSTGATLTDQEQTNKQTSKQKLASSARDSESVISGPDRNENPYPNVGHAKDEQLDQVILETFQLHGLKCPISMASAMAMQLTATAGLSKKQAIDYVREKMLEIGGEYPARTARKILTQDAKDWLDDKKNGGSKPPKAKRHGVFEDTEEIREFARRACERTDKNPELMFEGENKGDFDDVDWDNAEL